MEICLDGTFNCSKLEDGRINLMPNRRIEQKVKLFKKNDRQYFLLNSLIIDFIT